MIPSQRADTLPTLMSAEILCDREAKLKRIVRKYMSGAEDVAKLQRVILEEQENMRCNRQPKLISCICLHSQSLSHDLYDTVLAPKGLGRYLCVYLRNDEC